MLKIENVWQSFLGVIFRTDIFLFIHTVGSSPFPCVVHPADQIVVVILLADAREIRCETSALHLIAFADGVAGETAACFEQFFSVRSAAWLVFRQRIGQRGL